MGNDGELWRIMGFYGVSWGYMGNYGELWGIMGELWGNYGELWGIMGNIMGDISGAKDCQQPPAGPAPNQRGCPAVIETVRCLRAPGGHIAQWMRGRCEGHVVVHPLGAHADGGTGPHTDPGAPGNARTHTVNDGEQPGTAIVVARFRSAGDEVELPPQRGAVQRRQVVLLQHDLHVHRPLQPLGEGDGVGPRGVGRGVARGLAHDDVQGEVQRVAVRRPSVFRGRRPVTGLGTGRRRGDGGRGVAGQSRAEREEEGGGLSRCGLRATGVRRSASVPPPPQSHSAPEVPPVAAETSGKSPKAAPLPPKQWEDSQQRLSGAPLTP